MRERNAVKAARSVLWGGNDCKVIPLPDIDELSARQTIGEKGLCFNQD